MNNITTYKILGLDPGYKNFGWSCVHCRHNSKLQINIKDFGFISNTIQNFNDPINSLNMFIEEFADLINKYKPNIIVIERFQSRGLRGNTSELINMMIGSALSYLNNLDKSTSVYKENTHLYLASTWKNSAKRSNVNLKQLYKSFHGILTPHEIDSCYMCIYVALVKLDLTSLSMVNLEKLLWKSKPVISRTGCKPLFL